ncbi:MAG: HEAT repeat domain-containing protein [Bryobacteraceae bacterium]
MRTPVFLFTMAFAATAAAADARLEGTLARLARYTYDQGHQAPVELETQIAKLPAAEVETRLIEFLRSDASLAGKDFVCRQLSLIGAQASVPVLEAMLGAADSAEMARYALERIPGDAPLAALRNALGKAPAKARPGIANTLGIRRDAQAVPALSKLTSSTDKVLAAAAVAALGRIATAPALAALAALRKQGNRSAMDASLEAADILVGGQNRAGAVAIYQELRAISAPAPIRIGALRGLSATLGREAMPHLVAGVRETDRHVQAAAIQFLNTIPGGEVTAAMQSELPRLAPGGRARMVTTLALRGDRAAVPSIVRAAKDADEGVRLAALAALHVMGDPASVGMLAETAASETTSEAERTAARAALDRMRGDAVDKAIVAAIGSAQSKIKVELIRSAGERAIAAASGQLLASARDSDATVRLEAFRALRETAGDSQAPELLNLLTSSANEPDRRESERALSAALRRSPARIAAVIAAYQSSSDARVKPALLQVMGQSGAKEALPVLRSALADSNPDMVRAAILALTEWPGEEPLPDLIAFAGRTQDTAHQVLSLRGVLKLMDLPSPRPHAESVKILAGVMGMAKQPDEKRGVLALLPRFPVKEAMRIAETAEADAAVANEAKAAVQRLRRLAPE